MGGGDMSGGDRCRACPCCTADESAKHAPALATPAALSTAAVAAAAGAEVGRGTEIGRGAAAGVSRAPASCLGPDGVAAASRPAPRTIKLVSVDLYFCTSKASKLSTSEEEGWRRLALALRVVISACCRLGLGRAGLHAGCQRYSSAKRGCRRVVSVCAPTHAHCLYIKALLMRY